MSNLRLRIIFGSIYVALMVGGTVLGVPYFGMLMALIAFLSLHEMSVLAKKESAQHLWLNPMLFCRGYFVHKLCRRKTSGFKPLCSCLDAANGQFVLFVHGLKK